MSSYLAELEDAWRRNRQRDKHRRSLIRPKSLRGRDLVTELGRLYVTTKDPRFENAIFALFDRDIIDSKLNFTRWQPPEYVEIDAKRDKMLATIISKLISNGKSVRRACAECAATTGHRAASFDAAVKDLQKLHAKLGKSVQR
jgi:hypothetical protein